jgi:hypothetical protein
MDNHFHAVVETPQANLVEGMKWFLGTYTSRFNRRHRVVGHLFEKQTEERRRLDCPEGIRQMRRGWYLGDEEFRRELLAQMEGKMGRHHGGAERRESAEAKAEKILKEELKRLGWDPQELKSRRKGDPGKVQVARRLRQETTMSWPWIAASLAMGAAGYAADCVRELLKQS